MLPYISAPQREQVMSSGSISILHGGHYADQCLPLMGETDSVVVPLPVVDELDSVDFGI